TGRAGAAPAAIAAPDAPVPVPTPTTATPAASARSAAILADSFILASPVSGRSVRPVSLPASFLRGPVLSMTPVSFREVKNRHKKPDGEETNGGGKPGARRNR